MATEKMVNKQEKTFFKQTQDLAHAYFESRGRQHGNDLGDWYRAEKELRAQAAEKGISLNESAAQPTEAEIRIAAFRKRVSDRAYFMFEARNKDQGHVVHGHDVEDWLQAEKIEKELERQAAEKAERKITKEQKAVTQTKEDAGQARNKGETKPKAAATPENSPKKQTKEELRKEFDSLEKRAQEIALELQDLERAESANKNAAIKPEADQPENKAAKPAPKPENEKDEDDAETARNKWNEIFNSAVQRKEAEKTRAELKEELKKEILAEINKEKEKKTEGEKTEPKKEEPKKEEEKKVKEPNAIKKFWTKTKTFFQKHKKTIGAFALGVGLTVATWGTLQYFGQFLPFIPIHLKDIFIKAGEIINVVK